jgi:hypothetical protein
MTQSWSACSGRRQSARKHTGDPVMKPLFLALALAATGPVLACERPPASEWFDWDRYHARQHACAEKDRILLQCALVGPDQHQVYCDELALRQAQRDCSAFGPLGERR